MYSEDIVQPMKLEVYNSIVHDFKKYRGFGRKEEQDLKNKYKHIPSSTIGSIISSLVQRTMKRYFRKSPAISQKYYDQFQEQVKNDDSGDTIIKLSERHAITPSLFARSILLHEHSDYEVKEIIKDTSLIQNGDLAYHTFLANINDNQYGPYSDVIKRSIGLEYELRIERELKLLKIPYSDETALRSRGFDKTPDVKLDVPIAVDGFVINWIESKAMFGDKENHATYFNEQLKCYWNRFGPGLVIYWFGYLEILDYGREVNTMIILRTGFPTKDSIIQHNTDF